MSKIFTVAMALHDWELEAFNTLCEDHCCFPVNAVEAFVKWCVEDPERAKEWLTEEMV